VGAARVLFYVLVWGSDCKKVSCESKFGCLKYSEIVIGEHSHLCIPQTKNLSFSILWMVFWFAMIVTDLFCKRLPVIVSFVIPFASSMTFCSNMLLNLGALKSFVVVSLSS
jgi:hypothetical protein